MKVRCQVSYYFINGILQRINLIRNKNCGFRKFFHRNVFSKPKLTYFLNNHENVGFVNINIPTFVIASSIKLHSD